MKIDYVKIKNINSLRGEHTIDFREHPLNEAGLFAITGPTGSGKSTILDAICLALFNRIPRLGAISKNSIADTGSVLTRHEKEAMAEVGYSCSSGNFVSQWSIAVNRNQKLNDYDMRLYDIQSKALIDLKKSEVPIRNEAHIGLNFDQFVKSMMLAQGEFARFLKSSADERNTILERITDSGIYRQLGIMAFERNRKHGQELAEWERQKKQKEEELLPKDDLVNLEQDLKLLEEKITGSQKESGKIDQQLSFFDRIGKISDELDRLNIQLKNEEEKLSLFLQQYDERMQRHRELIPHENNLVTYKQSERDTARLQTVVSDLRQEREQLLFRKKEQLQLLGEFVKNDNLNEHEAEPELQKLNIRYQELARQREAKAELYKSKLSQVESLRMDIDIDFQNPAIVREKLETEVRQLQTSQEALISLLNADFDEDQLERVRNSQHAMESIAAQDQKKQQLKKEILQTSEESRLMAAKHQKMTAELPLAETAFFQTAKALELLQQELLLEQQKASLEDLRMQLADGKPCPLCGAEHHPYADHLPVKTNTLEDEIATARNSMREKEKAWQQLKEEYLLNEAKLKNHQSQIGRIRQELARIDEQQELYRQHIDEAYSAQSAESLRELYGSGQTYLKQKAKLERLENLLKVWIALMQVKEEGLKIRQQIDLLFEGDNFSEAYDKLTRNWNNINAQVISNERSLNENELQLAQYLKHHEVISADLHIALQQLGYGQINEALVQLMPAQEYNRLQEQKANLRQLIVGLNSGIESYQSQLNEYKEKTSNLEKDVLQQAKIHLQESMVKMHEERDEKKTVLSMQNKLKETLIQLNEKIDSLGKNARKWQLLNEMIGDGQGKKFSSFAQRINLKQLIIATNQRLKELNPRYLLSAPEDDKNELYVYDMDMGELPRSVNTLSGGETFLISLGLALGLADMASQKVDIKSLFIDEGFGTLDPDALESTLAMLEKLQMDSGKTIGIISHVDALKERIRAQIKLEKTGQGYSSLQLIG